MIHQIHSSTDAKSSQKGTFWISWWKSIARINQAIINLLQPISSLKLRREVEGFRFFSIKVCRARCSYLLTPGDIYST
ncbi:hypothetical protein SOVF_128670 isoform B [Spinacia oleracea]|nr:hypothetical protein SOVF_128670 isoform B [Spinacia oleracea]